MACRDFYDDHPERYFTDVTEPALKAQIAFAESALCAALNALEYVDSQVETITPKTGSFLDWINYKEAGITKAALVSWRKRHAELDKKHREDAIAKAKASGLAKLTADEREALGFK